MPWTALTCCDLSQKGLSDAYLLLYHAARANIWDLFQQTATPVAQTTTHNDDYNENVAHYDDNNEDAITVFSLSLSLTLFKASVHSFALLFEDFNALVVGLVWSLFLLKQITHTHTAHTQNIHTHRIYTHTQHTLIHINITLIWHLGIFRLRIKLNKDKVYFRSLEKYE